MRDALQTSSSLRARLVALLCLAGLVGSWGHALAHGPDLDGDRGRDLRQDLGQAADLDKRGSAHGRARSDADRPMSSHALRGEDDFGVSSDDSHHEHSSRQALEIEACLACRSGSQDDADRAPTTRLAVDPCLEGRLPAARTESWQRVPRHAHSPRAPPAQPTPIV